MKRFTKKLAVVFATGALILSTSVSAFAANHNNVSFETFITSVKAGEFVLSDSVKNKFLASVNSGDTDTATEIYRDYFDGDNNDSVGYVVGDIKTEEEVVEEIIENTAEEEKPAAKEEKVMEVEEFEEPETLYYSDIENDDMGDVGAPDSDFHGLSDADYNALCKMVQAEAGGEGYVGKKLVANVILNRVRSNKWPMTVCAVVSQPGQFTPFENGRFRIAIPDSETINAVNDALDGENNAVNIIYFKSVRSQQVWTNKILAFTYGRHLFYYGV